MLGETGCKAAQADKAAPDRIGAGRVGAAATAKNAMKMKLRLRDAAWLRVDSPISGLLSPLYTFS